MKFWFFFQGFVVIDATTQSFGRRYLKRPMPSFMHPMKTCTTGDSRVGFEPTRLKRNTNESCCLFEDFFLDVFGGIEENFEIDPRPNDGNEARNEMWQLLKKSRMLKSQLAASLNPEIFSFKPDLLKQLNGAGIGQVYFISKVAMVEKGETQIRLIRLFNPWYRDIKWQGR